MANQDTRQAARHFYETLNQALRTGDTAVLDGLLAPNAVDHDPTPDMAPGREGIKGGFAALHAKFPDYRCEVEDLIVDGDKVASRITGRMTHRGKEATIHGIDILRFERGLLVERWGRFENMPE